jgi:hypothetical protein
MKKKYLMILSSIVITIAIFILTLIQARSVRSGRQAPTLTWTQTSTSTPQLDGYATILFNETRGTFLPTIPTIAPEQYLDLSPELSFDRKVAVIIRQADGTHARYDMAWGLLYSFIKKLPREDTVIHISPIHLGSGGYALPTSVEISPTSTPTYGLDPNATIALPIMPTAIQPEIVDLETDVPYEDKPGIVVQHHDGSRTMYLIAPDAYEAFIEKLPEGDRVVGDIPPPSLMYGEPPTSEP